MASEQTETAADAILAAPEVEVAPEAPETATDPTGSDTASDAEALQARVRELEEERDRLAAEKAERERADAMAAIVSRHRYMTEEIIQALPDGLSVERLEAVAGALNKAIPMAMNKAWNERASDGMGKGGLDPTQPRGASWDRLLRNTL
ncbi:hypothetical protein [Streptomyces sp. A1-5]|uniref:hypothetical protein n=1 Tax=Streptomyces sp. A1-5 TaxID=2738410 RepID=UPI001F271848|nr:hypothetical protein [Streptomyces sp. A1-5]UJB43449.1 hypothetical protein HRD51_23935 [Streptomyces sp. A1-5]